MSFSVPAGSWLHIDGGNGCGKTSLLCILCDLFPAARGHVLWPASSQSQLLRPDRSLLHYIGHALGFKPDLTACENLCVDAQVGGLALSSEQAVQALAAQGLQSRARLPVRVLSQGQRQGVPLALLSPLLGLQFGLSSEALAMLALTLLIGTPVMSLLGQVRLVARVSASGAAPSQSADWQVELPGVKIGASRIVLDIVDR